MPNSVTNKRFPFPKKYRLKRKKLIDELFRKGKFKSFGFLKFRYLEQDQGHLKVVISISKRAGNSPYRNRLKRLIRESLRVSGEMDLHSLNCGIYITSKPRTTPSLAEVQDYIKRFIKFLPQ